MISFFRVKGESMEPFVREGDFVLCVPGRIREGDVIVARHPRENRDIVKRVKRVKKEWNVYDFDGRLNRVHEQLMYWVEGDNKHRSTDSRNFGSLSKSNIRGRVVVVRNPRQP